MECNRCGGTGRTHHRYEGGICFKCDGSGREGVPGDWAPKVRRYTCRLCGGPAEESDSEPDYSHGNMICGIL